MSLDIDALVARRKLKRRLTFWRLAALLLLVGLAFASFGHIDRLRLAPYVARITIDGVIAEDRGEIEMINDIADDSNAKALIVHINSPGGTTTGAEDFFKAIRRVAAKKPVVTTMGTLAASGGYVTAIAGDYIIARETTITGSIGVIFEAPQFSGLMEKVGVAMETVKSGALKGEPAIDKPLSEKGRAALQSMIDDSYRWFTELVAARRKLPIEKVKELADGRAYTGRQALQNGLVDELGGDMEARDWLAKSRKISSDLPEVDVDQTDKSGILDSFIGSIWQASGGKLRLPLDGMTAVWHPDL